MFYNICLVKIVLSFLLPMWSNKTHGKNLRVRIWIKISRTQLVLKHSYSSSCHCIFLAIHWVTLFSFSWIGLQNHTSSLEIQGECCITYQLAFSTKKQYIFPRLEFECKPLHKPCSSPWAMGKREWGHSGFLHIPMQGSVCLLMFLFLDSEKDMPLVSLHNYWAGRWLTSTSFLLKSYLPLATWQTYSFVLIKHGKYIYLKLYHRVIKDLFFFF